MTFLETFTCIDCGVEVHVTPLPTILRCFPCHQRAQGSRAEKRREIDAKKAARTPETKQN